MKIPAIGKKKGSKNPRFFCESCGAEVPLNAKNCPRCGKTFASVRCPNCSFSGEEGLFRDGCPVCGYSAPAGVRLIPFPREKEKRYIAGSLPLWVYLTAILALFLVIGALVFHLF
jgi:predicted RNA-binding Zn-ribbon protein involved in translation (DUF1610 family)